MGSNILPMTLGDMLDKTVRVIGKTILRNAAIAISFLLVPIILLSVAANSFYSSMPLGGSTPAKDPALLFPMIYHGVYFGAANLIFAVAALFAEIAVTIVIGGEINSQRIGYTEAVKMTFDRRWINGIGEGILKILILVGAGILMAIFIVIFAVAGKTSSGSSAWSGLLIVLFASAIVFVMIFMVIRLFFALTAVAVEDLGPVEALKKSWFIVSGHWWRTLGILIVFGLLSGLAISIVSAPIMFGSMWSQYKELFTVIGRTHGQVSPTYFDNFRTGMGRMIGMGTGISSLLSLLLTPAFTVVMYFDLRARHDDLPGPQPETDNPDVPLVTY